MKVFIIGGTGLLGSEGAKQLTQRGHEVSSIALPPIPQGAQLPPQMQIDFSDYLKMSDEEICRRMTGCEGFVFAAGVDERVEGPPPIYEMFDKYNNAPLRRLLTLAKQCGVRHAVICGSYFAHFDGEWPEMKLAENNPYIRSRVEQQRMALSFADDSFDVAVLQLPYIFGTQPGRKPVWVFLVEIIRGMKNATMYPRGGTAAVTVRQVGQCIAGALEKNRGGNAYPIGWYNLEWRQLLAIFHKYMGVENKKIITVPDFAFGLAAGNMKKKQRAAGLEGGLDMATFYKAMCRNAFIDRNPAQYPSATEDDIDAAIGASVRLCLEVLDGKTQVIDMKGE